MHSLRPSLLVCLVLSTLTNAAIAGKFLVRMQTEKREVVGDPIFWNEDEFYLLSRDGYLFNFDMDEARTAERVDSPFRPFTQGEAQAALTREFGAEFDVSGTGNYLVVHPVGQGQRWAQRFEDLYRSMIHYFSTRGIKTTRPKFPLVAVVFPTRAAFFEHAAKQGIRIPSSLLGYYTHTSNRIMLFDSSANFGGDWRTNAETIVHEAAHQTAFNVGIHNRFALPPRWIVEGLGTLFESPGIYDARTYPDIRDRINHEQLRIYRRYFPDELPDGLLQALVTNDKVFHLNPDVAYAVSWALTFMAAETQPSRLSEYLQITANKKKFAEVSARERLVDFQKVFGSNMTMTQARLQRYVRELP